MVKIWGGIWGILLYLGDPIERDLFLWYERFRFCFKLLFVLAWSGWRFYREIFNFMPRLSLEGISGRFFPRVNRWWSPGLVYAVNNVLKKAGRQKFGWFVTGKGRYHDSGLWHEGLASILKSLGIWSVISEDFCLLRGNPMGGPKGAWKIPGFSKNYIKKMFPPWMGLETGVLIKSKPTREGFLANGYFIGGIFPTPKIPYKMPLLKVYEDKLYWRLWIIRIWERGGQAALVNIWELFETWGKRGL